MTIGNDTFLNRVLAVEAQLGLDIIRQNPRVTAEEWKQRCEEAIASRRVQPNKETT